MWIFIYLLIHSFNVLSSQEYNYILKYITTES